MHDVQYCTVMSQPEPDLITTAEADRILGRRTEPYRRHGRITPVMRAGTGKRSPLLYHRADVEKLRDEIVTKLTNQLARAKG